MIAFQLRSAIGALCLIGCLAVPAANSFAGDASAGSFDTRAHGDLNQVIILCATEPASERFAATWQDWLERNPGADVYAAVDTVVSRAGTFRSMAIPGMEPVSQGKRPDAQVLTDHMLRLAEKSSVPRRSP